MLNFTYLFFRDSSRFQNLQISQFSQFSGFNKPFKEVTNPLIDQKHIKKFEKL